jgi:hypothetical protein
MMFKLFFLVLFAAYCGWNLKSHPNAMFISIFNVAFVFLSGVLFYFLPLVYFIVGALYSLFVIYIMGLLGPLGDNDKKDLMIRFNLVLTSFVFWPSNLFDFAYEFFHHTEIKK